MLAGTEAGIGHSDLLVPEFIPEITGGAAQIVVSDEAAHHADIAQRRVVSPKEFAIASIADLLRQTRFANFPNHRSPCPADHDAKSACSKNKTP